MVRSIVWTPAARRDLREIGAYIARDDRDEARRVVLAIEAATVRCLNPHLRGSLVPELADPALRQIRTMSWRILFRIETHRIRVVGVVHQRRLLGNVDHGFEEAPQQGYVAA